MASRRIRTSKRFRAVLLLSMVLMLLAAGLDAAAQSYPRCITGCTANDVELHGVYLDTPGTCTPGDPITANLIVNLYFNRNKSYCVRFVTDIYKDGVLIESDRVSDPYVILSKGNYDFDLGTLSWECGSQLELRNIQIFWSVNEVADASFCVGCEDYQPGSKCTGIASYPVAQPLIVDFSADPLAGCAPLLVQFTDLTTGGDTSVRYTYDWDFGDGSAHSMEQNPLHTYTDPGVYTVTLVVTDASANTDTEIKTSYITVTDCQTDLRIEKTDSVDPAQAGGTFSYAITVWNDGPGDATGVTVTETLPTGVTLTGWSATQGSYAAGTWTVGALASGTSATLTLTVSVDPSAPRTLENTACVTGDQIDPNATNDCDTEITTIDHAPVLLVEKSGTPNPAPVGSIVDYTILVRHAPSSDGSDVTIASVIDSLGIPLLGPTGDDGDGILSVGEVWTYTGSREVLPEDPVELTNEVCVSGTDLDGDPVTACGSTTTTVEQHPSLSITKTGPASTELGETVLYTIDVTNTGDIPLHNVVITDALLGLSTSIPLLGVGETTTLTPSYGPVTEADLPEIVNTATADSDETDPASDGHTVSIVTYPSLSLSKTGDASVDIGGTVTYTLTVTNTGDVTLHNVTFVDAKLGLSESLPSLAPGTDHAIVATFGPVTEAELPAVENTATADSDETEPVTDGHVVPIVTQPGLLIEKDGPATASIGESVTYTITVTNTGDITLHNVTISDPLLSLSLLVDTLNVGEVVVFHPTYGPITEADLPSILNTATADSSETEPVSDDHTVSILTNPSISLEKSGPATVDIGGTISYSLTVTNTGDVTLHNVLVTDALLGISESFASLPPGVSHTIAESYGPVTELDLPFVENTASADADEVTPVTDTHTVSVITHPSLAIDKTGPATVDIGDTITYTITVTNTGDVTLHSVVVTDAKLGISETYAALAPGASESISGSYGPVTELDLPFVENTASADADEVTPVTDTHTVSVITHPSLALEKTGPATANIGDTITYTITVTNTGDVTLHNVVVTDTKLGISETFASLAPGASQVITGSYGPIVEEDAPSILNTAIVSSDETDSVDDSHTITVATHPALSVEKTGPATANIGDTIDYTITVTNTGDVTLHNVVVSDAKLGISETFASLAPGASEVIAGSYGPVVEQDVPSILNTATADADETAPVDDTHSVTVLTNPGLSIEKTGPATVNIGDTIDYTITVTNTGDVTLHNVVVTDAKLGISETFASLAPGASQAISGTYGPVVEGDAPAVENTGSATSDETGPSSDTHTTLVVVHPELSIEKTGPASANIGDTIDYTITVTNTGDVTLQNVIVTDAKLGLSETFLSLAPGTSETVAGSYGPVSELDLPAIENTASADADEVAPVTDTHTVPVTSHPSLAIEKTGPATVSIGDTIDYTITVTNTGDVTLHNVVVTDAKLGISETFLALAPGASEIVAGSYGPVVEEDVPAIENTATADADEVTPVTDAHTVTVATHPALSIVKDGEQGPIQIGETISYTITVTNTGDITLHNVIVTDAKLGISETFAILTPGAFEVISGSYGPIEETDLPGPIVNTASATSDETGPVLDTHTVGMVSFPGLSIEKSGPATANIGDTIDYTITVENVGDVTLHNVVVTDTKLGISETFASLAPGASQIVSGTYGPVAEGDTPVIENTATADTDETAPVTDAHTVTVTTHPALSIEKTGPATANIGDTVDYTITVTNTGDVTLHNVLVTDAKLGLSETFASLAPGASRIVSGTYGPVAEGDTPVIENTATADTDETDPVTDVHTVTVITQPALSIEKTGPATANIGDTVDYTITVTNTGDVTLHNVLVTDTKLGISETFASLAPGASEAISGSYGPVSELDLSAIENTATADTNETDPITDSHTVTVIPQPSLSIEKTGPASANIGDTIDYTITVTNTGDVTLHNVVVTDAKLGLSETFLALAPGANQIVTGTYGPVSESDLPSVVNTASADADEIEPVTDVHTVTVIPQPSLSIEKTGPASANIGDTIDYTITVTNTGDVTLHNVIVTDAKLGLSETFLALTPGASQIVTGTYGPVSESDLPAVVNTASADADEIEPVSDTHTVAIATHPALSIEKTGPATANIGDAIDYTITVTNTGDVTLHNVLVTDAKLGLSETFATLAPGQSEIVAGSYGPVVEGDAPAIENTATADTDETAPVTDAHTVTVTTHPALSIDKAGPATANIGDTIDYTITVTNTGDITLHNVVVTDAKLGLFETFASLAPGASQIVTGTYGPVTEQDAPEVENTATADTDETAPVTDTHTVTVTTHPALSIEKSGPAAANIGDTIDYTITVTNTGDVTLSNILVTDAKLGLSETFLALAPGASEIVAGSYGPVAEEDVPAIENTASADADEVEPVSDTHTVTVATHPALAIVKEGGQGPVQIGDILSYTITVTNIGDITLNNVLVTDAKLGISETFPALAPGASEVISGNYGPIVEADLPGPIVNTASATSDETGPVLDTHTVGVVSFPALVIEKSGDASVGIGGTVSYTITVENVGDVTLHNVVVTDAKLGISETFASLAPGSWETISGSYGPVVEEDAPAIENTASADADEIEPVTDTHSATVITQPGLSIVKTGDPSVGIGGTVDYTITVENVGDVTLHNVVVTDAKLGISETFASLAPGFSEVISGSYGPVVEQDVPAIENTATANADEIEPITDGHTTTVITEPGLSIVKTGDPSVGIGGTVTYTITVENVGDVTLHNVVVTDAKLGISETFASLAPGSSETISGSYGPVAEGDAPAIENTATADADEIEPVSDSHTTTVITEPGLSIVKTGDPSVGIGGTVTYTITIENVGDVTLHNVVVTDAKLGISETFASLAPGESQIVSGSYGPVAEGDAPTIENTASADADEIEPVTDTHTTTVITEPGLSIIKTGDPSVGIGGTVTYTITVENVGDVTLHNVVVTDAKLGISETFAALAPAQREIVIGSYGPVSELDLPAVENTATADADEIEPISDGHTTPVITQPGLSIVKTGDPSVGIGGTVTYTITIENVGDVTLHNVVVTDAKLGISETFASLAPGASETISGSYGPVVEEDVPAIENTASADADEIEPVTDSHTTTVITQPGLSIVKTGDLSVGIGGTVTYTITVENVGDVTLHNVVVTDAKLGISETFASLAPGSSETISGSYGPVVEQDVPAIENTATANADEIEPITDGHTTTVITEPGLSIVKTGDSSVGIGGTVTYTITVENVGDVTLHNVVVTDAKLGISETFASLAPGQRETVSGSYGPVAEEDLPAVENTASADADEIEPVTDSHTTTVITQPGLSIIKTGDPSVGIGGTVTYTITIENVGDVTLHNVVVTDAKLGISETFASLAPGSSETISGSYGPVVEEDVPTIENTAAADADEIEPVTDTHTATVITRPGISIVKTGDPSVGIDGTVNYTITVQNVGDVTLHNVVVTDAKLGISETFASLAPGASQVISGSYGPVVEEDVPSVENTASADADEVEPVTDSHTTTVITQPGLSIVKTGDPSVGIGGTVNYTITVENVGDVTLHNVVVTDAKLGISETFASLAPGASQVISGSYGPVVEEDVPAIENTATADADEIEPVSDSHVTTVITRPALSIVKDGNELPVKIGDIVTYTITVENVGDVTLHNVVVNDAKLGISETFASLAPGASQAISGSYGPVTEQDIPGPIVNTATADSDKTEPVSDTHSVGITTFPAMSIEKTGNTQPIGIGETISYEIRITNVGDVTLHNVALQDPLLGLAELLGDLAPGESVVRTGTYGPVTEEDLPGPIVNVATASSNETEPVTDSHAVPIVTRPGLTLIKTGSPSVGIGGTIDYTITIENVGDVTLHNVVVNDAKLGISETFASVAPGASQVITGTYGPVVEEDVPAVENTAAADADEIEPVTDSHTTLVITRPGLAIDKTGPAGVMVGDSIDYTMSITNVGDVTLHNVVIEDAKLGISETIASLAPGERHTVGGTYGPVLEEDMPSISNTATANSDETEPVSDTHTVQVAPALIDLSLTKTVSNDAPTAGETVVFTLVLENAADAADATGVEVSDRLPSGYSFLASNPSQGGYDSETGLWSVGSLDAGDQATLQITAVVQPDGVYSSPAEVTAADQQDVDSTPANAATVSEDDDDVALVSPQIADLSVTKTVNIEEPGIGQQIEFSLIVTNLGPSDATGVTVSDPLPFGLSYVSDDGFGIYSPVTDLWEIGTVANGASVSLTITARVEANAGSTLVNTAEIATSDVPDPDLTNNQDSASIEVIAADLRVTKTVDNPTPSEGEEIVFTISVTNQGPDTATNVRLNDLLPDGLTYVSDDAPGTYLPSTGLWTVSLLPAGMTDTLRITARTDAGTAGTILTNVAEVSARQVDPNPSDNTATAEVEVQDAPDGGGGGQDPCTGKVIINEIAWAGTAADPEHEWIEIRNIGGDPVDLSGWTIRWRKKEPVNPEDFEWHVVPLTGVLQGAAVTACEIAEHDPTPSVDFEKRQIDDISWRVISRPIDLDESYLLVERRTDKTVSTNDADVVYDTVEPYNMELHNEGEIIELLDADGIVVDSANAFPMPNPAWPAGDAATYATMERTDPLEPDTPSNWHTNLGITTWGRDALDRPLVATADTVNSRPLEEMEIFADLTPTKTLAGARLEVALELTRQERRESGWPWIRVTRPIPAGGGGEALAPASYSFASRYSNDLYWLGIDTTGLPAGDYLVWVVYGDGETVLVPITILP